MDSSCSSSVVSPSQMRVRNILTLEERVRAIQAYECRPMYTKVAKMFNCSWEQIKNIIANKDAIMGFYSATKNTKKPNDSARDEMRQQKIAFLGECVYEYIQRIQFHSKADITEDLIRSKAFDFRDIMNIDNFLPNRAWINHLKATYSFSLANRQIILTRTPPASLDPKDIMTYCTKYKAKTDACPTRSQSNVQNLYRTATKIAISSENDATVEELRIRRKRKIEFLEKSLLEYALRFQFHENTSISEEILHTIACDLKHLLKIDNFTPNKIWINNFVTTRKVNLSQSTRMGYPRPLVSLDLKDILSYCSQGENRRAMGNDTASLLSDGPNVVPCTPKTVREAPNVSNEQIYVKHENADSDSTDEQDIKPNISEFEELSTSKSEVDLSLNPRIRTIDSEIQPFEVTSSIQSDEGDEELPKHVKSYSDALKLLKPIEEFAMLEENYRVIGLVSQLEEIFKNPSKRKRHN